MRILTVVIHRFGPSQTNSSLQDSMLHSCSYKYIIIRLCICVYAQVQNLVSRYVPFAWMTQKHSATLQAIKKALGELWFHKLTMVQE